MPKKLPAIKDMPRMFMHHFVVSRLEEIPFIVFSTFVLTFIVTRVYIHIAHNDLFNLTWLIDRVVINGIHIHHLNFGIIMLCFVGFWSLYNVNRQTHRRLAFVYGVALALTFDEFALWLKLEDDYYAQISFNAIVIIGGILMSIVYFPGFWKKMGATVKGTARFARRLFE